MHVRSWQEGYRGLIPQEHLDALQAEDRAARYRLGDSEPENQTTIVGVVDGVVQGFAVAGFDRHADDGHVGELHALYVDPSHWGTGLGRQLVALARADIVARGCSEALLWVLAGNERAMRFYGIDGWSGTGVERDADIWGVTVHELCYRRTLP